MFHTVSPAPVLTDGQPPTSPRGAPSSPDTAGVQLGGCQHSASPTCCLRNKQRHIGVWGFFCFPPFFSFSFSFFLLLGQGAVCQVSRWEGRERRGKKRERSENIKTRKHILRLNMKAGCIETATGLIPESGCPSVACGRRSRLPHRERLYEPAVTSGLH